MSDQHLLTSDIITPAEASKILHMSLNSFYRLLNENQDFPAFKLDDGRKWYIYASKIPNWIESQLEKKTS